MEVKNIELSELAKFKTRYLEEITHLWDTIYSLFTKIFALL